MDRLALRRNIDEDDDIDGWLVVILLLKGVENESETFGIKRYQGLFMMQG